MEVLQGGKPPKTEIPANPNLPWNPYGEHKETLFYCNRLGLDDLILLPDIDGNGDENSMYYVRSISDASKRIYPARHWEIIPTAIKEAKIAEETSQGLIEINLVNVQQLRDFIVNSFIPSYNWNSDAEKADYLSRAKKPRQDSYHQQITSERLQGSFLTKEDFVSRMSARTQDGFPWQKFSDLLDFRIPQG
jgi:hypothetical protein